MFSSPFVMQYLVSFKTLQLLDEEERINWLLNVLSSRCLVTVSVLWFFLNVPWVGLHCVIMVFPGHALTFCVYGCTVMKDTHNIHYIIA